MSQALVITAYILSAILFIFSLAGLSRQETAKNGNFLGILGMLIAVLATIFSESVSGLFMIILAMLIGAMIGINKSNKVEMTQIPQMIAILHSFVGLSAVLVGINSYISSDTIENNMISIHLAEIFLGVFIGAMTFTGSMIAFGKLNGNISSKPLNLPNKNKLNLSALIFSFLLLIFFIKADGNNFIFILMIIIALLFGAHLVSSIGGADMPVVISMLNSYSGWAAAATGFILSNDLLIITGALVGSSGAILSYIMCKSMNRSFISVIAGGFGIDENLTYSQNEVGEYKELKVSEVADLLKNSKEIIIVPGYGMAVAQAQYPVADLTNKLKSLGINVRFAIHPVAGRLPGHMNVLLAEAKVSYDIVLDMEEINNDFSKADVALVIGANDTVNPASKTDANSPIAGMPVLEVWESKNVIIFKRSMNTGYSGVQNPLFFNENSFMCFGDAKKTVEEISKLIN